MNTINVRRFGFAVGATLALLYLGCMFVILTAGREAVVAFLNSLLHVIDVTQIVKTSMSVGEMLVGVVEVFILGWLAGASIASIYNYGIDK